jgi:CRISP-associated protein Cas1
MSSLLGRLGLDTARVPQADRHGLLWLTRGNLYVESGNLRFAAAGAPDLPAGNYDLPFQMISCVLLQPGTTVTHDAMRLLAAHGTGLVVTGDHGVRMYASLPTGPGRSEVARRQALAWADEGGTRIQVALRMYAWRLGEVLPETSLDALRGMEGARMRESYKLLARQYNVEWGGRLYDRSEPEAADLPNQAINHIATAMEAAASVAVAVVGAIPQLGFIHETASSAFALDIADLYRTDITVPVAFRSARTAKDSGESLEAVARKAVGLELSKRKIIAQMIDRIKALFEEAA